MPASMRILSIRVPAALLLMLALLPLSACASLPGSRRSAGPTGLLDRNREQPSLSDGGRLLASLLPRGGQPTLVLQEQPSGRELPTGPLGRWRPHRSPSLSHNGRYLALLVQQGARPLAVIWDRASNDVQRFPLPPGEEAQSLSLSPEGRHLAIAVLRDGRPGLRLFDLSTLLEPDRPAGLPLRGGGPEQERP